MGLIGCTCDTLLSVPLFMKLRETPMDRNSVCSIKYTHVSVVWFCGCAKRSLQWRHNKRDCVSSLTSLTMVYSTVYSGADQRKHQSSALLAFVRGFHRWLVNSPHKRSVTRKSFHLMTSSYICELRRFILHWFASPALAMSESYNVAP